MEDKNQVFLVSDNSEQPEGYSLLEYLIPILKNKWLVLAIVVVALIVGVLYNQLSTPVYQAQSSVTISLTTRTQLIKERESVGGDTRLQRAEFHTKVQMISSQPLAERVVKELIARGYFQKQLRELGHAGDPSEVEGWFIGERARAIRSRLQVDHLKETTLALIKYQSPDPQFAQEVVNLLAEVAAEYNREEQLQKMESSLEYLQTQLEDARREVERAEIKLYKYRLEHNIFHATLDRSLVGVQRSDHTSRLNEARVQRRELESKIAEIEKQLRRNDHTKFTPVAAENTALPALKAKLVEAEVEFDRLKVTYADKHPLMIKAEADIQILKRHFERELKIALANLNYQLEVVKSKEKLLAEILSQFEREAVSSTEKDIDYLILEREAKSAEDLYGTLLGAVKEMNINANALAESIVMVHERAQLPKRPLKPNKPMNLMLALALGVMLGGSFAYAREYLNTTVRDKEDVRKLTNLPVFPFIPLAEHDDNGRVPLITSGNPKSMLNESVTSLYTHLKVTLPPEESVALAVTSSEAREGKSFMASNLALSMARDGKKTLLIDCDLRRPTIHSILGLDKKTGLFDLVLNGMNSEWPNLEQGPASVGDIIYQVRLKRWTGVVKVQWDSLAHPLTISCREGRPVKSNIDHWRDMYQRPDGFPPPRNYSFSLDGSDPADDFEDSSNSGDKALEFLSRYPRLMRSAHFRDLIFNTYLKATQTENLYVLTAGSWAVNPNEVLGSEKMKVLLQVLRENFDRIIIDTPPMWIFSEVGVLAPMLDGLLLVARYGQTHKKMFQNNVQQLQQVTPNILGVVINAVDLQREGYYGYYYYKSRYYRYYRQYHETEPEPEPETEEPDRPSRPEETRPST